MYEKNLTETVRLRLSTTDMDFLRKISEERASSVSECIRSIIGEYRRSLETIAIFSKTLDLANGLAKEVQLSNGDTKSNIDN